MKIALEFSKYKVDDPANSFANGIGYRRGVQALSGEGSLKRLHGICCNNWVDGATGIKNSRSWR